MISDPVLDIIAIRWLLRDIRSNRLKIMPLKERDLQELVSRGLVEVREDLPCLTSSGYREIGELPIAGPSLSTTRAAPSIPLKDERTSALSMPITDEKAGTHSPPIADESEAQVAWNSEEVISQMRALMRR